MNEPVKKHAIGVGLFILVGLLFLFAGVLIVGNLHSTFTRKLTVSTVFGNVNGLQAGNNIWFSGVKIGTVKKLELYGESQVRVVMNIDVKSKEFIRKDAKVKIGTDGLIGNKILVIYGGTSSAAEIEEGDTLNNEVMLSADDMMKTFQENNLALLELIRKISDGEGTIGKLINSDSVYNSIAGSARSIEQASANAQVLIASLASFSAKLNAEGNLANDLATDTVIFNSLKYSVLHLQQIADTAAVFVNNLKEAEKDPKSPVGILLHDEETGASLKATIRNLESGSAKLDKDLEALQSSFLLRKYFKKEAKKKKK